MPASKYYRTIVAVCFGLAVCIVMLSIVLYNNGPRGRLLRTSSDLTSSQLTKGSTMTVVFDRPIEQIDYKDIVSLSPGLDISTRTTTQSIVVTLNEHLRHDTEYVLAIEPELYDAAGIKMKQAYRHTFTTSPPSYTYVQRQYETNEDTGRDQANDSFYLADTEGASESIFEHPEIRMYDANSAHAVVVAQGPEYDELYTIDLATKSVRREALPLDGRIYSVAMSDSGSQALYSIWPEGNNLEAAQANALPNRVESLNV